MRLPCVGPVNVTTFSEGPKRLFLGRPMRSSQLSETLLPKLAMPVFCSDPLSSVAYATEEILLILSLGGLAFFHLAWYVAAAIVVLLAVVVASYRQTCRAYPNGGGAYSVACANLGQSAGLVAASALLHNQSALRLKARLLFTPGVMVANVPYHLRSSDNLLTSDAPPPGGNPAVR
jgi:hypothetical protein